MIKTYLQGVEELKRRLGELLSRGRNLKPLMGNIAQIMAYEVDENFQAGGRDPKWPVSKRARESSGQTLIDQGALVASIHQFIHSDNTSASVGTNLEYAAIHNFGGPVTRKPHTGSVRLRTDAKGNLLRQGSEGLKANLAVFARSSHKRAVDRPFSSAGYTWQMPQREFMKVSADGIGKIEAAAAAFILP